MGFLSKHFKFFSTHPYLLSSLSPPLHILLSHLLSSTASRAAPDDYSQAHGCLARRRWAIEAIVRAGWETLPHAWKAVRGDGGQPQPGFSGDGRPPSDPTTRVPACRLAQHTKIRADPAAVATGASWRWRREEPGVGQAVGFFLRFLFFCLIFIFPCRQYKHPHKKFEYAPCTQKLRFLQTF